MTALMLLIISQSGGDTVYNLRDFRIPEDGITSLTFAGTFNLANSVQSYYSTDTLSPEARRWQSSYGYSRVSLKRDLNINGETRFIHLSIIPSLTGSLNSFIRQLEPDSIVRSSLIRSSIGGSAYFYGGWYLAGSSWFTGGKARLSEYGGIEYSWPQDTLRPYLTLPRGKVLAGGGLGRVRNVASAARAWLFLEENGAASYDNIQQLAAFLSSEWKYKIKYWRYQKYFYADADSVLVEAGALSELTPYQLMRLREIVENTSQFERLSGNRLSIMSGLNYNDYDRDSDLEAEIALSLIGGQPVSRRWQVSYSTENEVYLPFYSLVEGYRPEASSESMISLSYYISDSWRLSSEVDAFILLNYFTYGYDCTVSSRLVPVELTMYVDNHLDLSIKPYCEYYLDEITDIQIHDFHFGLDAGLNWRLR